MNIKKIILCFGTAFLIIVGPFPAKAAVSADLLVNLTNQTRQKNNLPPLVINQNLVKAAQFKAEDMIAKDYFAHTSPEGINSWYWFKKVEYNYRFAGENLAINFSDSQNVFLAWMNSPSHRDNILDQNFTEIGIAAVIGDFNGRQTVIVVQMFGSQFANQIANNQNLENVKNNTSTNLANSSAAEEKGLIRARFKEIKNFWSQIYLYIDDLVDRNLILVYLIQ